MANLDELYITANVEEDELVHIKEGQKVEYTVDSFPGRKFSGQVISIGEAANSVFSLLPAQNTGNSYVKITQRVPVKISINESYGLKLLPGMSAVVKIHIR
jgi:multidrug resistance efflux pump